MSNKREATYYDPTPYECPEPDCEKRWATSSAAEDCCGDWLGYD